MTDYSKIEQEVDAQADAIWDAGRSERLFGLGADGVWQLADRKNSNSLDGVQVHAPRF